MLYISSNMLYILPTMLYFAWAGSNYLLGSNVFLFGLFMCKLFFRQDTDIQCHTLSLCVQFANLLQFNNNWLWSLYEVGLIILYTGVDLERIVY